MRRIFIDNQWRESISKKIFNVYNPATGEILAEVADGGRQDMAEAIDTANRAFPLWSGLTVDRRSEYILRLARNLSAQKEETARIIALESGKPITEARGEVEYAYDFLVWYAEQAKRIEGELIPSWAGWQRIVVLRQPVGVVGCITPWNFPLAMITRKMAPALAAGCTVVIKPAEQTPLSALKVAELCVAAEIPPGVVNIVPSNTPQEIAQELLQNPVVRKISFTGSTEVGRYLLKGSADQIKRVSLELGGNAPFVVFEDADLQMAAEDAVICKFRNAGQTCISANRFYIHRSVYRDFLEVFAEKVSKLRLGNGLDEATQIGPLIDRQGYDKVVTQLKDALEKGAKIRCGGQRETRGELARGFFFQPTVIFDTTEEMLVMREETFGPICPVSSFGSEQEVIHKANNTIYGLAAYFYTNDYNRIIRVAERLEYGMIGINNSRISGAHIPFGGFKQSGLGREGGRYGIDEFVELKYLNLGLKKDG